jgi:hypothetical protein
MDGGAADQAKEGEQVTNRHTQFHIRAPKAEKWNNEGRKE